MANVSKQGQKNPTHGTGVLSGEAGLLELPECVAVRFDSTVFVLVARLLICSLPRSDLKQGLCDTVLLGFETGLCSVSFKHVNAASLYIGDTN